MPSRVLNRTLEHLRQRRAPALAPAPAAAALRGAAAATADGPGPAQAQAAAALRGAAAATAEGPEPALLTPAEIAAFKRDGFVVKPNLVSREVCERCLDVAWGLAPPPVTSVTSRHDQESWIDPGIRGAWPQLARDEATGRRAMPQGCWYERHNTIKFVQDDSGSGAGTDPTVLALFNSGPVQDVVAQLIGTPVKRAESCKGIYFIFPTRQDEGHHLELALHRDIQPFQVSAVVYLADTPPGAGGYRSSLGRTCRATARSSTSTTSSLETRRSPTMARRLTWSARRSRLAAKPDRWCSTITVCCTPSASTAPDSRSSR